MARNQNGGFNKFLNFIGLVDDTRQSSDAYDDYNAGGYGRPSTYVPPRQRTGDRNSDRTAQRRSIPAQGSRSTTYGGRTYGGEEEYRSNRRSNSYSDSYGSEYSSTSTARSSTASSRPRSRFEEPEEQPAARPSVADDQALRPNRGGNGQKMAMISLSNLRDANKVITALVKGYTVVMTLETDDEHLKLRIVDTLSGAVFALKADIKKATDQTYVLAPKTASVKSAFEMEDRF